MRLIPTRAAVLVAVLAACGGPALPAFAIGDWPRTEHRPGDSKPGKVTHVPEIDAGAGVAAIGAIGAVLAFGWERRRRR